MYHQSSRRAHTSSSTQDLSQETYTGSYTGSKESSKPSQGSRFPRTKSKIWGLSSNTTSTSSTTPTLRGSCTGSTSVSSRKVLLGVRGSNLTYEICTGPEAFSRQVCCQGYTTRTRRGLRQERRDGMWIRKSPTACNFSRRTSRITLTLSASKLRKDIIH